MLAITEVASEAVSTRVSVLSGIESPTEKKYAKEHWPPAVGEEFFIYDENPPSDFPSSLIEVGMMAVLDDKKRIVTQCCEKDCANPDFGTATTSSLFHATKHLRVHALALRTPATKKKPRLFAPVSVEKALAVSA